MAALLRPALTLVIGFSVLLTAVAFAVTGIAGAVMPSPAGGSLIREGDRVVGSSLIGQNFAEARYFQPRPSATSEADPDNAGSTRSRPYNAAASAASQLGPTSAALLEAVKERVGTERGVPADAATGSGSGLDPHISPANARAQVARVATARNLRPERVTAILEQAIEGREFGLLGEPRVNVLRLNRALDAAR